MWIQSKSRVMNIANWFAIAFLSFLAYNAYQTSKLTPADRIPDLPGFLVPVATGKERNSGGSNRDASMFTQSVRRQATVNGHWASGRTMKETTHTAGFGNGVVEVYSMSDICVRICKSAVESVCATVLDAGTAVAEFCEILDGGSAVTENINTVDGGISSTDVCPT